MIRLTYTGSPTSSGSSPTRRAETVGHLCVLEVSLCVQDGHVRQEYERQHEYVAEHPHVHQLGLGRLRKGSADLGRGGGGGDEGGVVEMALQILAEMILRP